MFFLALGGILWKKKRLSQKKTTAEPKKAKKTKGFLSFPIFIRRKSKPNKKRVLYSSSKTVFEPTRVKDLNFQAKNTIKMVNTL